MQTESHPPMESVQALPTPNEGNSKDIEDFIYLISHDVRSSVRALIELPQWIAEDLEEAGFPVEGAVGTSIEMMNRHTSRLDRMLVDLLTYSRVGRMQQMCQNDISQALDEVLEEMQVPAGFDVIRDLGCSTLEMGDRDILTLLGAMILNAIKHHDKNKGRIIVTCEREEDEVVLSVADDGPGIPEEFRERVFGAMSTLRPRDEVEGSGMGLANVRKIATLYGGKAIVRDSPYGRGNLVEVRLALSQ
ncbi:MAG: HAMP domain-containing sensor histidine kinase [Sulfitobacter sp.]